MLLKFRMLTPSVKECDFLNLIFSYVMLISKKNTRYTTVYNNISA